MAPAYIQPPTATSLRHERPGDFGVAPTPAARVRRDFAAPGTARVFRHLKSRPGVLAALVVEGHAVVVVEREPSRAPAVVAHFQRQDLVRPRRPLPLGYQRDEPAVSDEERYSG